MFQAIRAVRKQTHDVCAQYGHCTIQQLSNLVEAYTAIDEARYIGYNSDSANPIWGEYLRWSQFVPYDSEKSIVEVRYATHLPLPHRRFVIAKELCHALDTDKGSHTASNESVEDLVTELSLLSVQLTLSPGLMPATFAEKAAEFGAIELMVPIAIRKEMLASGEFDEIGVQAAMDRFRLPETYIRLAFRKDYCDVIETVL